MDQSNATVLRCPACGTLADRLFTWRHRVRSLSLGKEIDQGDLVCERCLRELEEELTQEEMERGPA
jgi:DNA-directed RNA polymerase subunit RPC12/RpoP